MNQQMMMRLRKMQKELENAQKQLEETVFTGSSAGIASVEVKGTREVISVKISPDAFESKEDIDMIEDAILSALNDANKKIDKATAEMTGKYAGGLGLGGLF